MDIIDRCALYSRYCLNDHDAIDKQTNQRYEGSSSRVQTTTFNQEDKELVVVFLSQYPRYQLQMTYLNKSTKETIDGLSQFCNLCDTYILQDNNNYSNGDLNVI